MSKGDKTLICLNEKEYKAANAAIKLLRGEVLKNAYIEGFNDGMEAMGKSYFNTDMPPDIDKSWEGSHTKYLDDEKYK